MLCYDNHLPCTPDGFSCDLFNQRRQLGLHTCKVQAFCFIHSFKLLWQWTNPRNMWLVGRDIFSSVPRQQTIYDLINIGSWYRRCTAKKWPFIDITGPSMCGYFIYSLSRMICTWQLTLCSFQDVSCIFFNLGCKILGSNTRSVAKFTFRLVSLAVPHIYIRWPQRVILVPGVPPSTA